MKFFDGLKDGVENIKNMLYEKNYMPFVRPLIALIIVFGVVYYMNGIAESKVFDMQRKVDAKKAEADSAKEYQNSKLLYEKLLKQLPDYEKKDEWLLRQLLLFYNKIGIEPLRTGKHILDEEGDFTHSSVNVDLELTYEQLGKLIEMIENNPEFMRISNMNIKRAEGSLGRIKVTLKVHTLFIKEKTSVGNGK